MPSDKAALRAAVKANLPSIVDSLNAALKGTQLGKLEAIIKRLGRDGKLPHWYKKLKSDGHLPNLDGKTIGSVLEMLLVAVLEHGVLQQHEVGSLRINPARGVDLPDLDLGVKSPSENNSTSEPFFSAYERLYGNDHDCLVLLTDYQIKKTTPPLKLQVIKYRYLTASEMADMRLCAIAKQHLNWLLENGEGEAKRLIKFLANINQSDWRAKRLLKLADGLRQDDGWFHAQITRMRAEFNTENKKRTQADREPIPDSDIAAIEAVLQVSPRYIGVLGQLDNWINEALKETARGPNENEWQRIIHGNLDGKIGMSFALQWRYNFGNVFGKTAEAIDDQAENHEIN